MPGTVNPISDFGHSGCFSTPIVSIKTHNVSKKALGITKTQDQRLEISSLYGLTEASPLTVQAIASHLSMPKSIVIEIINK